MNAADIADLAAAIRDIAAAIREAAHQGLCCTEHTVVEKRDGRIYWRRNDWLADAWAPLGTPGATSGRRLSPDAGSDETAKVKPRRPARR